MYVLHYGYSLAIRLHVCVHRIWEMLFLYVLDRLLNSLAPAIVCHLKHRDSYKGNNSIISEIVNCLAELRRGRVSSKLRNDKNEIIPQSVPTTSDVWRSNEIDSWPYVLRNSYVVGTDSGIMRSTPSSTRQLTISLICC